VKQPENETVVVDFLAGLFKKATRETLTAYVRKARGPGKRGSGAQPEDRARLIQLGAELNLSQRRLLPGNG
jgi:hypothetical protein